MELKYSSFLCWCIMYKLASCRNRVNYHCIIGRWPLWFKHMTTPAIPRSVTLHPPECHVTSPGVSRYMPRSVTLHAPECHVTRPGVSRYTPRSVPLHAPECQVTRPGVSRYERPGWTMYTCDNPSHTPECHVTRGRGGQFIYFQD